MARLDAKAEAEAEAAAVRAEAKAAADAEAAALKAYKTVRGREFVATAHASLVHLAGEAGTAKIDARAARNRRGSV